MWSFNLKNNSFGGYLSSLFSGLGKDTFSSSITTQPGAKFYKPTKNRPGCYFFLDKLPQKKWRNQQSRHFLGSHLLRKKWPFKLLHWVSIRNRILEKGHWVLICDQFTRAKPVPGVSQNKQSKPPTKPCENLGPKLFHLAFHESEHLVTCTPCKEKGNKSFP